MGVAVGYAMNNVTSNLRLLVRTGAYCCALPLSAVVETMRPLPITRLEDAPAGVIGMSIVRGTPTPVLDLSIMLGGNSDSLYTRFVSLRVEERNAVLAVDTVIGIREFAASLLATMPPLLADVRPEVIEAISALDSELVLLLRSAGLIPVDCSSPVRET